MLERDQQWLLTDTASQMFTALINYTVQEDELEGIPVALSLDILRRVLIYAREVGIQAAWASFVAAMQVAEPSPESIKGHPASGRLTLTREEAVLATQDATFLSQKLGTTRDDPQVLIWQKYLSQKLANDD